MALRGGRVPVRPLIRRARRVTLVLALAAAVVPLHAQRGGGRGGPPPAARESAALDLTGYWVSVVVEDWKWRMVTPRKGVYDSLPLNAEARKVADSWDPADRGVPESAPKRVTRGGSYLCNVDYCLSYRPSARRGNDPYNPMSHLGFRLVMSQQDWEASKR